MPLPGSSQHASTAPRRRNGRPQACEPCRRRKVACDHQVPVCSRCKSAEIAGSCFYSAQDPTKSRKRRIAAIATLPPVHQIEQPKPKSSQLPATPVASEGYLGATSYRYAMCEAESKVEPLESVNNSLDQGASSPCSLHWSPMANDKLYDAAMRALRGVPERTLAHKLFESYVNPNDCWSRLAARRLHSSFWDTFGAYLDGERSLESLLQLATKLYENNSKPLFDDYSDPNEWFESFSGLNMRWEGLGILFIYWAHGANAVRQGLEGNKAQSTNSSQYDVRYKDCAWDIIDLTRNMMISNTLFLYFIYKQTVLESIVTGEDGLLSLRLGSEAMSLLRHLGLHAMHGPVHDRGICNHIKRLLLAKIYLGDKTIATFMGWPPTLSQRFVSTPLPLDIPDEVLLGDVPWQDDLVDSEGWNTLGDIYPSTLLRARASISFIRETIVEISLQTSGTASNEELLNLRERQKSLMDSFPKFLIFKLDDVKDPSNSGPKLYAKLLIQLEHLLNLFFIERLLNKLNTITLSTEIIQISQEIITVALIFWTHKDKMTGLHEDYEWLAVQFASPAAGILCLELLRPYTDDTNNDPVSTGISRVDLVQNLCLLRSFLGWIEPLVPGRKLTATFVQKVIQRVLDQTLNCPINSRDFHKNDTHWAAELEIGFHDLSFDLLDTFDWMRAE